MAMLPASRPKLAQADAQKIIAPINWSGYSVNLFAIRGYYKTTMGNPVKNDRGIYDDSIFISSPDIFASFNANTDPSIGKPGVASLKPNAQINPDQTVTVINPTPYLYVIGMHNMKNPYEALRQYGRVTVTRDDRAGEFTDTAAAPFYIDIHKGGFNTTSSLGCQTVHPTQWIAFLNLVKDQLKRYGQKKIPYALFEQL